MGQKLLVLRRTLALTQVLSSAISLRFRSDSIDDGIVEATRSKWEVTKALRVQPDYRPWDVEVEGYVRFGQSLIELRIKTA